MPELPEVEVLRRSLEPLCCGRRIDRAEVLEPRLREPVAPDFAQVLTGRSTEALERRAKYLLLHLSDRMTLMVHLGMSGRLLWTAQGEETRKHDHWYLKLDDGSQLTYRDIRRFGLARLVPTPGLARDDKLRHLGIEPLSAEFDGAWLRGRADGRRRRMKEFLMDQTVVVGVGNIYASEALHCAGVHPRRKVSRTAPATWDRVAEAVRVTLERAIDAGGSTLNDFRNGLGDRGYFQVEHAVYDRSGEPCRRCGASIRRAVQGGRSTFYCPGCQH